MREREREKVITKIKRISGGSYGGALYFRPFSGDDKAIEQIAATTGETKSAVLQKLVRCALTGDGIKIGDDQTGEKLDWLIRNERRRVAIESPVAERLDRLEEFARETEERIEAISENTIASLALAREIFCMTDVCVSYLNQIFTKLLEFLSPLEIERLKSSDFANRNILALIEHSLSDLEGCAEHHRRNDQQADMESPFFATKLEKIHDRISSAAGPEAVPEKDENPG